MTTYIATALLNLDNPFRAYDAADRLFPAATGAFTIDRDLPASAVLEQVFAWGNKMKPDQGGEDYPRLARSLSVGDVVTLATGDGPPVAFTVKSFGWGEVNPADLVQTTLTSSAVLAGAVSQDFEGGRA